MNTITNNQFLAAAYNIGTKLCRDAIWAGNKCNWVGPSMEFLEGSWKTAQRAYATDLYSGTSGIGYFLAHLYSLTHDPILKKTALACFEQVAANADQIQPGARIGFYTGWAGLSHVLQHCGPLLGTSAFEKQATEMLDSLEGCNLSESGLDILAGSAGAISLLLSQTQHHDQYISTAKKIADYLIETAYKSDKGWSWNTLERGSANTASNLAGFSHGTAGIAWAFTELYHVTKENRYAAAAQKAFDYERYLFNPQFGNWPDLRNAGKDDNNPNTMDPALYGTFAWCHGAPGIGLSRLRAFDLLTDPICKQEAEAAVASTRNTIMRSLEGKYANFSLCHGIGGNTELLLMAAASLNNPDLLSTSQQIGMAGMNLYANNAEPWPCGIVGAGESPGLMLGTAGIGYFYLRLSDPINIPSILITIPKNQQKRKN